MCSRESDSVGLGTLLIVTAIRVRGGEDTRVFRIAQEALPSWDCTRAITGRVEPLRALRPDVPQHVEAANILRAID